MIKLRGLPVARYTEEELRCIWFGLGVNLGAPVFQNRRGELMQAIRDEGADVGRRYGQFAEAEGKLQMVTTVVEDAEGPLLEMQYGPAATVWRMNFGWRRRKEKAIQGFMMNPVTGHWVGGVDDGNGESESEADAPPDKTPPQRIVPYVEDRRNILIVRPHHRLGVLEAETLTTLQYALKRGIEGLFEVSMALIRLVIRLAPIAVFCFMFNLTALFGFDLLVRLGAYVLVVLAGLLLHLVVTYSVALRLSGHSPRAFFRGIQEAMLMAFSTASSNATLPTALRVADRVGLPPKVSRFVLTVGATANQNGTALFEGVTVLFLAQFFGVDLDLGQQLMVMFVCILGGIGTAGVPAGSLPVVALICGMVGVPAEGIGIILGVDRFLDMCRTTLNVTGDLVLATMVSKDEKDVG